MNTAINLCRPLSGTRPQPNWSQLTKKAHHPSSHRILNACICSPLASMQHIHKRLTCTLVCSHRQKSCGKIQCPKFLPHLGTLLCSCSKISTTPGWPAMWPEWRSFSLARATPIESNSLDFIRPASHFTAGFLPVHQPRSCQCTVRRFAASIRVTLQISDYVSVCQLVRSVNNPFFQSLLVLFFFLLARSLASYASSLVLYFSHCVWPE